MGALGQEDTDSPPPPQCGRVTTLTRRAVRASNRGMDETPLSAYGHKSTWPSPVNRMMAEFASGFRDGEDINLGVGYVNERTMPATEIAAALGEVLRQPDRHRQPLNYGGPTGSENLIAAVRRYLVNRAHVGLGDADLAGRRIIVGPNGATSLLESLAHLVRPGLVITSDPMYYIYTDFLQRLGFELLAIPEDADGMRVDRLEEMLAARRRIRASLPISFFYVVTVNNPSCAILSNTRRAELIALAARLSQATGHKIPVVLDRAYEDLIHDPTVAPLESGLRHDPHGLVYEVGTLSKVLAPALRIGYLVGPEGPLMQALIQRTSDGGFSAPLMNQEIATVLLDEHIDAQLARVRAGYREKAVAVRAWLDEYLGDELESIVGGRAGFYYYLTFRRVETHEDSPFFRYLTRTTGTPAIDAPNGRLGPRVVYIPGQHCTHPLGDLATAGRRQLRISYGFEELENIRRALQVMRDAARYAER